VHIYKSRFLVRGEVWYDQAPEQTPVDWILYRQRSQPLPGAKWQYYHTILLDLHQSAEALLGNMSKSAVYKIRRARNKDKVVCECRSPASSEDLDGFEKTYRHFAAVKGLDPLDRPLLDQLADDGFLELAVAKNVNGEPLVHHVYYHGRNRSCLLHSVSLYQTLADSGARNAIGRANRYLFWQDILRHKEQGLASFDFGGWYPGDTNQALLDINRFKEEFGGRIERAYNCQQIVSLKGWIALKAAEVLNWGGRMPTQVRSLQKRFARERQRPSENRGLSSAPLRTGPSVVSELKPAQ
jgi:hypothetical protein